MLDPNNFPIATAAHKKLINPRTTAQRFASLFQTDDITKALENLLNDQNYDEWTDIRNVLTHRGSVGRQHAVTMVAGAEAEHRKTQWGSLVLDVNTTHSRRQWFAQSLRTLLITADTFTANHF